MLLLKKHYRVLRYIYRNKTVSYSQLSKKFCGKFSLDELNEFLRSRYVELSTPAYSKYGDPMSFSADTLVHLSTSGIAEVEAHQWFDLQYVITQILVPIVIALCTYALTCFLGNYF